MTDEMQRSVPNTQWAGRTVRGPETVISAVTQEALMQHSQQKYVKSVPAMI